VKAVFTTQKEIYTVLRYPGKMAEVLEHELTASMQFVKDAWDLIAPVYYKGAPVEKKKDGTPLSPADKIANRYLVDTLSDCFPEDSIVSEEVGPIVKGDRTWYVDPIDGTRGFYKRSAHFAIQIGLAVENKPVLGIVYWPVVGELYFGLVGHGAYKQVRTTRYEELEELKAAPACMTEPIAIIGGLRPDPMVQRLYDGLGVKRYDRMGGEGLRLMKIAENIADVRIVERERGPNTWDICAPHAILDAAGGIVSTFSGPVEYDCQAELGKYYFAARSRELADRVMELGQTLGL
jgi:3'(2'), 5'-bisphosphate nucleotidase